MFLYKFNSPFRGAFSDLKSCLEAVIEKHHVSFQHLVGGFLRLRVNLYHFILEMLKSSYLKKQRRRCLLKYMHACSRKTNAIKKIVEQSN